MGSVTSKKTPWICHNLLRYSVTLQTVWTTWRMPTRKHSLIGLQTTSRLYQYCYMAPVLKRPWIAINYLYLAIQCWISSGFWQTALPNKQTLEVHIESPSSQASWLPPLAPLTQEQAPGLAMAGALHCLSLYSGHQRCSQSHLTYVPLVTLPL